MTEVPLIGSAALRAIVGGLFLFALTYRADAGGLPPPIEERLERADWVVIGQITKIDESKTGQNQPARPVQPGMEAPCIPVYPVYNDPTMRVGLATVAVKEVLKGDVARTIEFPVILEDLLRRQGGPMRGQILHTRRLGQSGIWVGGGGLFLSEAQAPAVRQVLQAIKERKWSEPVNGLRAWALMVISPKWEHADDKLPKRLFRPSDQWAPGIIFAVKNVSNAVVYVPRPCYPRNAVAAPAGLFAATVKGASGRTFDFSLDAAHPRSKRIECKALAPGATTYLDPYSIMDWRDKLTPGKYSAVVSYRNDRVDGEVRDRSWPPPVTAWTGQLKAPPVEFVLTAEDVKGWKTPPDPGPPCGPSVPQSGPISR
jgi:hypothetical protein